MGDKGYLHPFWDARLFDSGVGDEIRTVLSNSSIRKTTLIQLSW